MPRPIALVGSIGAGKTTIARALAGELGFVYLGADDVRLRLTGDPAATQDGRVWQVLSDLADEHLAGGVVLDSTGCALAYRRLVYRLDCFTVRLSCSWRTWQQREGQRGRSDVRFPLWRSSTWASGECAFDVSIATDEFSPSRVLDIVLWEYGAVKA